MQQFNVFKFDDYNLEKRLEQLENLQNEEKKKKGIFKEVVSEKDEKQESEYEYDSEEWDRYLEGSSEEDQNSDQYEDSTVQAKREHDELQKIQRMRAANSQKNNPFAQKQNMQYEG